MVRMDRIVAVFSAFLFVALASAATHPWEVRTIELAAEEHYDNPYGLVPGLEGSHLVTLRLTGIAGKAKGQRIELAGSWNGGSEWVVNVAAPSPGTWTYRTRSADAGLDGREGRIEVTARAPEALEANPVQRGFIRVREAGPGAGHFFEYSDGHPFLWVGDTWWNWTKRSIDFDSFKRLVDDRAAKGFTIGQMFVPGNGWSQEASCLNEDYTRLDPAHVQRVENMIRYANSKGITVWIHGWWSRPDLSEQVGEDKLRRWCRFLVHRFAAYNVIWVIGGEYNMHDNGGFDLSVWDRLGAMIDAEDPYERIVSAHNTPPFWKGGADAPQWSTASVFHDAPWLDYNQSQTGHGRYANEMIPRVVAEAYAKTPAKPIVVTEPWYEFIEGNPSGLDLRLAIWGSFLSGAAGHTYGGGNVWRGRTPESPGAGGVWPFEPDVSKDTLDYEGARSMAVFSEFARQMDFPAMKPHPELVSDYPQPLCLANPGDEYIVYLRYGGYMKLDLRQWDGREFVHYWVNPETGETGGGDSVQGGGWIDFMSPWPYPSKTEFRDWVLYVKRKE